MTDVTVRQLRAFAAVVKCGSFSEAAKAMHLSQAALSGLIRELENRVGIRLLDRTTRRVSPTAVGSAFDPLARRVLVSLDEALESLSNLKELRGGVVRVAAPEPLSCTLLPTLIATYRRKTPGVTVRFDDVPIAQVLENVYSGSADVGFGPAGITADETIERRPLLADPVWVALPQNDPLAQKTSLCWSDLRKRVLINYMPNLAVTILSNVPSRHHPKEVLTVNRVNTALSMLKVGCGAVLCPSLARPLVQGFGLKFLALHRPTVKWPVAIFTRRNTSASPAVESFLRLAFATSAS
jgi:DNA-binding transcriptional LysR family regulator